MTPRIMIAGARSGCGKTTVTCALLQAFQNRGLRLMACKSGPDYIDPMFHSRIIGTKSCNLDLFLADMSLVRRLLSEHSKEAELTVIEGAMGFYDGIAMTSNASAWELAKGTETPVIFVADGRGSGISICAEIKGFCSFRAPNQIKGVILDRISPMLFPGLKKTIEAECGVPVLGYLPKLPECAVESRHLGLVTAGEIQHLREQMQKLAETAEKTIDLDAVFKLAETAEPIMGLPLTEEQPFAQRPVVAVAKDEAFCFYYRDNLEMIRRFHGDIVFFSPLYDKELPSCDCLYLGGGYPELYAERLSENASMRASIQQTVMSGLPLIAECGGFLYLQSELQQKDGDFYPMCGVFQGKAFQTPRLSRFGYLTLHPKEDSLLFRKGEEIPAHEFHYWDCSDSGTALWGQKPLSQRGWECGIATSTMYAGFPHLYFPARPELVRRFLRAASDYRMRNERESERLSTTD